MENSSACLSLFDRWPTMASDLGYSRQRIHHWKKVRKIPAGDEQDLVLRVSAQLGKGFTAEDIMYPFPEDRVQVS